MIRRLVILDASLILLLIFGAARLRRDWFAFAPAHQVSAIQPAAEDLPGLPAAVAVTPALADWTEIPTRNLFSFDRNDVAVLAPPPEPAKPIGPRPVLFGTMLLDKGWTALLASGQTQNRNSRPFRIGENIDGWTIVEIAEKSVVVESDSTRQTLSTNDWVTLQIPRDSARTLTAPTTAQSVSQPAASAPPPSAAPAASSTPSGGTAGSPRMCQLQTPFGTVTRPCEDSSR